MKTLYEFLVKQHISNNYEYECYIRTERIRKEVYVCIDNVDKWKYFINNSPIKEGYSKPNKCEEALSNNSNTVVMVTLDWNGTKWAVWNEGMSNNERDKKFEPLHKTITIDNFTKEYWDKNNWSY